MEWLIQLQGQVVGLDTNINSLGKSAIISS
jgi:hypothetical protein